ncbi:serine/threonine-protein kinase [Streptomyces sp. XY006]|uniref:serine/threonine-protein kinase n=1 Tax=Streptomyces sp. XY006 TaxID=2021410 RepID=UPI00211AD89F|nr:serine/threonine protein kinase [Streptomyces sp. XY006]
MGLREVGDVRTFKGCARILAGRYRLDTLIGSGGAADVYRGLDLRLRRPVAVKVFRTGTGFDTEDAFRSETVILARLQHPGLVTAFDAGHHGGDAFLVMQLIDGPTLKSRLAEAPLSWEAAAALGTALADALAHAHEAGIVHRDVKPSNIILDSAGHPHLTDFGISRLLDATTRTATGTLTGTAAYLSPEQVLGRPVGRPADIYALGLVLLESVTGRLEYDGGPLESAIARLHRPPALPDFLPDGFATLLRDMTGLDEQDRPTARDCVRALTRLAGTATTVPAASGARPVLSVVEPTAASGRTDATHRSAPTAARTPWVPSAPPAGPRQTSRVTSLRGRLRVQGAAAALAALVAAGVLATDGSARHDTADGAAPEAAPTAPDQADSATPSDTPARHETTPSASSARPSRSASEPTSQPVEAAPAHTESATRPDSTARRPAQPAAKAETKAKIKADSDANADADAAGQGREKAPAQPDAAWTKRAGKKAAHAN